MPESDSSRARGYRNLVFSALMLGVTAVWGWTFTVVKDAIGLYPVVPFLAVRFMLAALVMAPVALPRITRSTLRVGSAIGLVLAAAYLLQTFGLETTTPTNCGLITGLFVMATPVCNRLLFRERLPWGMWLAVGVSLVGLVLLTGGGPTAPTSGDALTLGCAVCFGLQIALLDRYAADHDALALAVVQIGVSGLIFTAVWLGTGPVVAPPAEVWPALLLCSVIATAACFTAQTMVQQRLPAIRIAIILTLEPVFAALFGYLLAGDRLGPIQLVGAAVMVATLAFAEVYPRVARNGARRREERRANGG